MVSRSIASADSAASLRLERLAASSKVEELMEAWTVGAAGDEALIEAERRILAREPVGGLTEPRAAHAV